MKKSWLNTATEPQDVREALLQLLARQIDLNAIPVACAMTVVAALAAPKVGKLPAFGLLALVVLSLAVRRIAFVRFVRWTHLEVGRRLHFAIALGVANGLIHASSLFFFPALSPFERAVQTMVLTSLAAGTVTTSAGYAPFVCAYVFPTMLPLAWLWAVTPMSQAPQWLDQVISVLLLMYVVMLMGLGRDTWRLFSDSFAMRLEQRDTNRRLEEALRAAEEASRAKTRFLASASHDLRQPMHTVAVFGAALSMRQFDETTAKIVQQMNTALVALAVQLDALLDISKLDAGVVRPAAVDFDLCALLRRIVDESTPNARRKGLRVDLTCPEWAPVKMDPLLVERIMRNLIDNAIKYTERGQIRVEASRDGAQWQVAIADTGCGIPVSEQERVFEEFYQVGNRERDRTQGLGLGLSIVKRLAALLHIELRLTSDEGRGTTVTLKFAAGDALAAAAPSRVPPTASRRLDGMRVLLLDDEEGVRASMSALLQNLGCSVAAAADIAGALDAARAVPPQIVLADLRLRGTESGITAIQAVRTIVPTVAGLLVSGDTAPERLREVHESGLRLLHKPVTSVSVLVEEMLAATSS
jgi:signal transduction histidine kinase/CheY-like chemotaxis protein